nr:MAG TPA: hypothetical protein [Caudoviricetes sp.]
MHSRPSLSMKTHNFLPQICLNVPRLFLNGSVYAKHRSPRFQIEASFTARIPNRSSGRLIWTIGLHEFVQSPHQRKIAAEFSAVRSLPTFLHLVICFLRVSFQMKPLMRRKARISNPTFKPSPHICSKSGGITLRSSLIHLLAHQTPQERFRRALWLRL